MATALYRLGRLAFTRRVPVLLVWLLVLIGGGLGAATLSGPTSDSFSIPGTESQEALDLLEERMPEASVDGATARVVFVAPEGGSLTTPAAQRAVGEAVSAISELEHVASVVDPFTARAVSQDGSVAYAAVQYAVQPVELTEADQEALFEAAGTAETQGPDGLVVEVGGDAVQAQPEQSIAEAIGILVALLVLLLTFGGLVAAGLPVVTAMVGVGLGVLGIEIATGFVDLGSTTASLATMLGLAVGIDYALFIVSRYRHELLHGRAPADAAGRAVGTAGSAVVFAGATVVIALAALSVVGIPFLTQMGLAAAATVAVAVLVALTLLPALLGLIGMRVLGRKGMAARDSESDDEDDARAGASARRTAGERWVTLVQRHRWVAVVAVVAGLGAMAVPAADLRLALPSDETASTDTTQRRAYDALAEGFGPGFNGPLVVVADLTGADRPDAAGARIAADLAEVPGVVAATPPTLSQDGSTAIYSVIPATGPSDAETEELVQELRDRAGAWADATGAELSVTGATALGIDVSETLSDALLPYLAVVVGLAFVLLVLVFRSVLVPLKAAAGFLLSVGAAFGAVVAVFQWGWLAGLLGVDTTGPIISFLPILLIGILFGLAMDYEVFLVTRMREEFVHGLEPTAAVAAGFRHGARVVTAAAVIMIGVFAGFATAPEPVIKSIGFGLAVGIAIDAFLVRMTLVPALMTLMGRSAWWLPRWLDRLVPDLDVEGERLAAQLDTSSPARPSADARA